MVHTLDWKCNSAGEAEQEVKCLGASRALVHSLRIKVGASVALGFFAAPACAMAFQTL